MVEMWPWVEYGGGDGVASLSEQGTVAAPGGVGRDGGARRCCGLGHRKRRSRYSRRAAGASLREQSPVARRGLV